MRPALVSIPPAGLGGIRRATALETWGGRARTPLTGPGCSSGPPRVRTEPRARPVLDLTVYKHFPDNAALYPACSAHYLSEHPLPDFQAALAPEDPTERVRSLLRTVYAGWYRTSGSMMRNLQRDRHLDPALDEFMRANSDAALGRLTGEATAGFELVQDQAARLRALIRVALDFWTWERLTGEGMDDEAAAELMTDAVAAVAAMPATAR